MNRLFAVIKKCVVVMICIIAIPPILLLSVVVLLNVWGIACASLYPFAPVEAHTFDPFSTIGKECGVFQGCGYDHWYPKLCNHAFGEPVCRNGVCQANK